MATLFHMNFVTKRSEKWMIFTKANGEMQLQVHEKPAFNFQFMSRIN